MVCSRVFDKIFNLHQIGSVQAIAEPIQFQLHHTMYNINIYGHFPSDGYTNIGNIGPI